MIYKYYLECKKGCEVDSIIETDVKDFPKKIKKNCPHCGRKLYQNDEKTELIGATKITSKYKKKNHEEEISKRLAHKKKRKKKV